MVDTDSDRYPTLRRVMWRITKESPLLDQDVERVEINLLASGEATYKVWAPRADEADGGYLAPETSS